MRTGYDTQFLEELKSKNDIVEVIGSYTPLEQKGRNYWARCPFHHEKTASFSINPEGQYYHCFGCGKGGDVIGFIMDMESIDFTDAIKLLADRVKMPLPETSYDSEKIAEIKEKKSIILNILKDTALFYVNNLKDERATPHLEYLQKRGLDSKIVRMFGLGASLSYDELPKYLLKKNYLLEDMISSGVVDERNGRVFDSLFNRLIFPIINQFSEVVAFGGRVLEKTDFAKYKNTRETMVFTKSKILYNMNFLKKLKQESVLKDIIIVEGYMDTVSLYQAGIKNVVASMGTSLTKDQARILKRYAPQNVYISYDGDSAGQNASIRGLEILKDEGLNVKVVSLPDGLDPDEVVKQRGKDEYDKLLKNSYPLIDFKILTAKNKYDLTESEGKRKYVAEALKIIKLSESRSEQEELLKILRTQTGITFESLKRDLDNTYKIEVEEKNDNVKKESVEADIMASRFILASLLFEKNYTVNFDIDEINFDLDVHREIKRYIKRQKEQNLRMKPSMLYEYIDEENVNELNEVLQIGTEDDFDYKNSEKYFNDCVKILKIKSINEDIERLSEEFTLEQDLARRKELANLLQQRTAQLKQI